MRKLLTSLTVCVAAVAMTSCTAGPKQLSRTVDDWDNQLYIDSPWIDGILNGFYIIPLAGGIAGFVDFFVDGYHFWVHDAWDGKGTGFKHADFNYTDGYCGSLTGGGEFLKVEGK